MLKAFLIKYGEIGVKGKNRYLFEDALVNQIKFALKEVEGEFAVTKVDGRIYVQAQSEFDYDETVDEHKRVFGIIGICPMVQIEDNGFDDLAATVVEYFKQTYKDMNFTFKVNARRARKNYPLDSMQLYAELVMCFLRHSRSLRLMYTSLMCFFRLRYASRLTFIQ